MRTKPTYKQKLFAQKYIKNKGNATQSYKDAYNTENYRNENAIRVNANKVLTNPIVEREINKLLPKDEEESNIIKDAYSTARANKISWSELHTYLETSLKLKGYLKDKQDTNTNIAIVIEK